jgi:hypothetical protein
VRIVWSISPQERYWTSLKMSASARNDPGVSRRKSEASGVRENVRGLVSEKTPMLASARKRR